jgi:hypothetical protein
VIEQGDNDIDMIDWPQIKSMKPKICYSICLWFEERKTIYREGLGATLISDDFDISKPTKLKRIKTDNTLEFPYGGGAKDTVFNIDYTKLNAAVANAFDTEAVKKNRSLLVIYKDKIIAEYETGFTKESKC